MTQETTNQCEKTCLMCLHQRIRLHRRSKTHFLDRLFHLIQRHRLLAFTPRMPKVRLHIGTYLFRIDKLLYPTSAMLLLPDIQCDACFVGQPGEVLVLHENYFFGLPIEFTASVRPS